jgi:hypothetical protein
MRRTFYALLAAALVPACVFAVDGVVLINQSTVKAAGSYPYVISQPGSYKLTSNLVVDAGKNGINIVASNVTIDLNGFTISPQAPDLNAEGVQALNLQAITIRNGVISGFNTSVDLVGTSGVLAEELILIGTSEFGFGFTNADFGSNGIVRQVAVPGRGFSVVCPMVVAQTIGQVFAQDVGGGACSLTANP